MPAVRAWSLGLGLYGSRTRPRNAHGASGRDRPAVFRRISDTAGPAEPFVVPRGCHRPGLGSSTDTPGPSVRGSLSTLRDGPSVRILSKSRCWSVTSRCSRARSRVASPTTGPNGSAPATSCRSRNAAIAPTRVAQTASSRGDVGRGPNPLTQVAPFALTRSTRSAVRALSSSSRSVSASRIGSVIAPDAFGTSPAIRRGVRRARGVPAGRIVAAVSRWWRTAPMSLASLRSRVLTRRGRSRSTS